jgi:hypothetical protein
MRKTHTKEAHVKDDVKALLRQARLVLVHGAGERLRQSRHQRLHRGAHGSFIAIETKFGSNKPTPMQIGFLNSIRANDGFAFVVNDKNLDWLEAFLESFEVSTQCVSKQMEVPPEHGARMLNALAELSNKLLDLRRLTEQRSNLDAPVRLESKARRWADHQSTARTRIGSPQRSWGSTRSSRSAAGSSPPTSTVTNTIYASDGREAQNRSHDRGGERPKGAHRHTGSEGSPQPDQRSVRVHGYVPGTFDEINMKVRKIGPVK